MMNPDKIARTSLALGALLVALSGCQKHEATAEQQEAVQEDSAEHAGKEVDEAVGKVGQKIEEAGEHIQDKAKGDTPDK